MNAPAKTVLVVDDEPTLVATLKYNLEREGYRVVSAGDGEKAITLARTERPDLMILDLMLPAVDGLEVCRILRREMSLPILMLTARVGEVDKVVGLEIGADDYVTKPFSTRELLARIRALLRRTTSASDEEMLVSGDLRVDLKRREVTLRERPIELKPKEMELLIYFMRNKGRAFTREQLLREVWGYDFYGDSRTVDVHVSWLRQKIEEQPGKPVRILTVRGVGYRFEG
ncbi:MAG TPA: response regulator transcription factor [Dehalococcoidia bacterium]|jgi:two-component system OmpR family response regulator|nr:response regulator transcription factor [Dehalococcoidia bacterium]